MEAGVDRVLWSRGHRPVSISKDATGLAALRPDLPANRWQRTLRSHFVGAAAPEGRHVLAGQGIGTGRTARRESSPDARGADLLADRVARGHAVAGRAPRG